MLTRIPAPVLAQTHLLGAHDQGHKALGLHRLRGLVHQHPAEPAAVRRRAMWYCSVLQGTVRYYKVLQQEASLSLPAPSCGGRYGVASLSHARLRPCFSAQVPALDFNKLLPQLLPSRQLPPPHLKLMSRASPAPAQVQHTTSAACTRTGESCAQESWPARPWDTSSAPTSGRVMPAPPAFLPCSSPHMILHQTEQRAPHDSAFKKSDSPPAVPAVSPAQSPFSAPCTCARRRLRQGGGSGAQPQADRTGGSWHL